ncbi:solute carrier family 12 member 9 isoform X2 [Bacillus rossius redtenbacheri]
MLAPEIGSTNSTSGNNLPTDEHDAPSTSTGTEKAPLILKYSIFNTLRRVLGGKRCGPTADSGYVEFGIDTAANGRTLGTFAGVFSPVALSMFSALLFLRVGFLVGNAGLLVTWLQFVIAYGILLFTVASVCAVSTNGAVEGGGAYFMISRTLGPEFGGSIGTLFFFANVVSSALYIIGCAEGLVENFGPSGYLLEDVLPDGKWWRFLYCSALNVLNLLVCVIGAGMFAKTSVAILAIVCICLVSVVVSFLAAPAAQIAIPDTNDVVQNATFHVNATYTGFFVNTLKNNLYPEYGEDYTSKGDLVTFATVFGVLFSGVTGIMAGANMSGELRNPARNIPLGTLSAVGFTFVCYVILSFLTAATCSRFLLQNNYLFMMQINLWPPFVTVGILTATFSASLSNLIGSSRVLEALAKDNVFGVLLGFVSRGVWKGNPLAAVMLSWLLVELMLLIGSLNVIAQINSVLFLLSYLALNLACLGLELASAPNFRPSFKFFTWHTALIGLLGTLIMMFVINAIYASSSIVLCLMLVVLLHLFSPSKTANWGSISQALIFHQVRKYLLLLDSRKDHVKFWRPQMLLMVGNPSSACPLIHFVNDLKKSGLYVLGHVKVGRLNDFDVDPTLEEYTHWLTVIDHLKVKAFVELTVCTSVREGLQHLIRMSGLGAMKPNTIVLGFYDNEIPVDFFKSDSHYQTDLFKDVSGANHRRLFAIRSSGDEREIDVCQFVGMVTDTFKMRKNLCLCRYFHNLDKNEFTKSSCIDVWPINFFNPGNDDPFDTTSLFMLQLSCILKMLPGWKSLQLRVFMCQSHQPRMSSDQSGLSSVNENYMRLEQLLQQLRISASIHEVPGWSDLSNMLNGYSVMQSSDTASKSYIFSVNQMVHQLCSETAVTFLYLPKPPTLSGVEEELVYPRYLQLLTELTSNLPPTILVHGVSAVTSTTL